MKTKVTPRPETLARYVKQAGDLAKSQPDGRLPHVTWLRRNGYANLDQYIRAHVCEFGHLKQNRRNKRSHDVNICKRQISLAQKLADENQGKLPSVSRLMKMKKTGLLSYINKHPDFFKHIPKDREHSSREEHITTAEKLARDNGGSLPGGGVISQKGWGLYKYMKRNPEHFKHIPGAIEFFNNGIIKNATLSVSGKSRRRKIRTKRE